jgi:hypothetical protein
MKPAMMTFVNDGVERADRISPSLPPVTGITCSDPDSHDVATVLSYFSGSELPSHTQATLAIIFSSGEFNQS